MCLQIIVLQPIMASICSVKVASVNNTFSIIWDGSPNVLFLRTLLDRARTSRRRRQRSQSVYILAYTALMNEPSRSNPAIRNSSAGGVSASAAALSAAAASAPLALVPGTLGRARQLLSSIASASVSTFSLLCQAFLVHLC